MHSRSLTLIRPLPFITGPAVTSNSNTWELLGRTNKQVQGEGRGAGPGRGPPTPTPRGVGAGNALHVHDRIICHTCTSWAGPVVASLGYIP